MLKTFKYICKSVLIGVVVILVFNFLGQFIGLQLPFNLLSIGLVGFFHLPGILVFIGS